MAKKKTCGVVKVGDRNFRVDKVIVVDGKRYHIQRSGYQSAQEAKEAIPSLVQAKMSEIKPFASDKTFDDLVDQYDSFRSMQVKMQTLIGIRYLISKHILPYFSGMSIAEALTESKVREWYLAKASSSRDSQQVKNNAFGIMRQIIDRAWRWHYITSDAHQDLEDIVQSVKRAPKAKRSDVWTYAQETQFLASIPRDSVDFPMFSLFCYLGCRIGEFQGLQWKCLNPRDGTIVICQQIVREGGTWRLTGELKTSESYRVDKLDKDTLDLLMEYRATLNTSEDDEFIFPSPYSSRSPLSRTEFRRRFFEYIEKSGVPKIVPHGVRHSKATMIAGVCRNAEEVAVGAKFLGHSAAMFMGTYVSSQGVDQSSLIARLSEKGSA